MYVNSGAGLLALIVDREDGGKKLVGSLIGNGSVIVIGAILGLAVIVATVIFLRKKKNNKGEKICRYIIH